MIGNLEPEENVMSKSNCLVDLTIALQQLQDECDWSSDDELKVCIAGTLKKDKFIVIQNTTKRGETK
jgi:hypothetical protein